jgi:hypothetical protein
VNIPKWVEFWDDERGEGNGIIVTLRSGWSFENQKHEGVRGFDTIAEARRAVAKKIIYPCACADCLRRHD